MVSLSFLVRSALEPAVYLNSPKRYLNIKRTYQPKKRYRRRVHGFLRRMASPGGARVIQNRRRKGRHKLTPG